MKRINLFISDDSFDFLKSQPANLSEQVRWAIESYKNKIRSERVSASQSRRAGDSNE